MSVIQPETVVAYREPTADGYRSHSGGGFGTLSSVGAPYSADLPDWVPEDKRNAAYEQAGLDPATKTVPTIDLSDTEMLRRYAIAVCNLGHGNFEQIADEEMLSDVMILVPQKRMGFEDFKNAVEAAKRYAEQASKARTPQSSA